MAHHTLSHFLLLLLLSSVSVITASRPHQPPKPLPTITAPAGTITGTTSLFTISATLGASPTTVTIAKFLGIPYAKPPVRFELAKAAERKKSIDARQFSKACIQQNKDTATTAPDLESEDCLYVNIWTPNLKSETFAKKAVMLWFHGGNLETGSGSLAAFDGSSFVANQDVVVVTFNYRLNAFGFPNTPHLPLSAQNLGFRDQRLALDWVAENVASFNGDPNKITLFGESAGASSIDRLLLTLPSTQLQAHAAKPLPFRAAILQSGQATISAFQIDTGPQAWSTLVSQSGCSSPASDTFDEFKCVRDLDAFTIRSIVSSLDLGFRPVNDNLTQIAIPALNARARGEIARVPLLIGSNGQEANMFLTEYGIRETGGIGFGGVEALVRGMVGEGNENLVKVYMNYVLAIKHQKPWLDYLEALLTFATDVIWTCPTKYVSQASSRSVPTWRYYYNATIPNLQIHGYQNLGAYHGSEIDLVFGTYNRSGEVEQEVRLSSFMQKAWANFAKNPSAGPGWEAVNGGDELTCLGCRDDEDGGQGENGISIVSVETVDTRCSWYKFDASLPDI